MQIANRLSRVLPFLLVIAVGLYLYFLSDTFDYVGRAGRAGPDVWPKIVLGLMLFAAAWGVWQAVSAKDEDDGMNVLVRAATRAVGKEEQAEQELADEAGGDERRSPLAALAAIAAMLLYVGCIPYVGFTIATFGLMLAIILLAGYRRLPIAALIAFIGAIAFFFVFQRVAYISLPLGVGPFKELSEWLMFIIGVR